MYPRTKKKMAAGKEAKNTDLYKPVSNKLWNEAQSSLGLKEVRTYVGLYHHIIQGTSLNT